MVIQYRQCNYRQHILTEAVVGFKRSRVTVQEDVGMVQLCVEIFSPDIECPVLLPFELIVTATNGTAGNTLSNTGL